MEEKLRKIKMQAYAAYLRRKMTYQGRQMGTDRDEHGRHG